MDDMKIIVKGIMLSVNAVDAAHSTELPSLTTLRPIPCAADHVE